MPTHIGTTHKVKLTLLGLVGSVFVLAACGDDVSEPMPMEPEEPLLGLSYIGSDACGFCHTGTFVEFRKSGHPYKLNKVENGVLPSYPFSEVPDPPAGVSWDDVAYVIGGFGWKARFVGQDGYIITAGGANQFNLATGEFVDYHKDELKPYDCGTCHTTGYQADGNQDGLEGIVGQWAAPGIQCEECHGPGSLHQRSPQTIPLRVDTRAEACGKCHNRGGVNNQVIAKGGFIRHHEQYNEMTSAGHAVLECVTCHDPHTGVRYNDEEGAAAITVDCDACHSRARESILNNALAVQKGAFDCESCHMPYAAKSAVAFDQYAGDVRTHIVAINADETAAPFTEDGKFANPFVTLEFACLACHPTEDKAWAAANAPDVHGPGFAALRLPASASRPR